MYGLFAKLLTYHEQGPCDIGPPIFILKKYSNHNSLFQPFMESLIDKENPGEEILLVFYDGIKMTVRRQESWENNFGIIMKSEKFFNTKWWRNDLKKKNYKNFSCLSKQFQVTEITV